MFSLNHALRSGIAAAALGLALAAPSQAQNYGSTSTAAPQGSDAPQGADRDLAVRVKQALHSGKGLDDRHVDVTVEHGDVVLTGFVQDSRAMLVARDVATKAAGGRKIVNHLTINQNYPNAP